MKRFFVAALVVLAQCGFIVAFAKSAPRPEHIVFIGLDGLSSEGFDRADMPFVKSLLPEASYTTKKRSVLPSSSAINWATMFNGSCPELHGYLNWGSQVPELTQRVVSENGTFPTVFTLLREAYPDIEMGCFYEWGTIKCLVDSAAFNEYSLPYYGDAGDIDGLTRCACDYITRKHPAVSVFVFDHPDAEGHNAGWCGKEYLDVLSRLDSAVECIFSAARSAGFTDRNTVFIITSDHGGIEQGHGGTSMSEMETPFIILGKGIRRGWCFDDISMMQFDVASTVASLYRLRQPQVWVGKAMPVLK